MYYFVVVVVPTSGTDWMTFTLDLCSWVEFASSHGPNVQLGLDYRSAKRVSSYSKGIVISSAPLPNNKLFQVYVFSMWTHWLISYQAFPTLVNMVSICVLVCNLHMNTLTDILHLDKHISG